MLQVKKWMRKIIVLLGCFPVLCMAQALELGGVEIGKRINIPHCQTEGEEKKGEALYLEVIEGKVEKTCYVNMTPPGLVDVAEINVVFSPEDTPLYASSKVAKGSLDAAWQVEKLTMYVENAGKGIDSTVNQALIAKYGDPTFKTVLPDNSPYQAIAAKGAFFTGWWIEGKGFVQVISGVDGADRVLVIFGSEHQSKSMKEWFDGQKF